MNNWANSLIIAINLRLYKAHYTPEIWGGIMILEADHKQSEIRQDGLDSLEMTEDWVTTARTAGYTSTLAPHSSHWSHTATHSTLSSSASSWSSQWRVSQCGLSWFTLPVLHTPPQPDHIVFPVSQPGITKTLHTPPPSSWQVNDPVARHHLNIILTIISYEHIIVHTVVHTIIRY